MARPRARSDRIMPAAVPVVIPQALKPVAMRRCWALELARPMNGMPSVDA